MVIFCVNGIGGEMFTDCFMGLSLPVLFLTGDWRYF